MILAHFSVYNKMWIDSEVLKIEFQDKMFCSGVVNENIDERICIL